MNELKKINGNYVLHRNGKTLACALVPPVMMPGKLQGTVSMGQRDCGDMCPLFDIENDIEGMDFVNLCHGVTLKVKIIDEKPAEKAPFLFPGAKNL